jgi:hypothetical protein
MLRHIAGARVKGESPPRRPSDTAWESDPDAVRPTRIVRPSPALCGCYEGRSVSFRDTVPPTPAPPPRRAPRKRTTTPSKGVRPPTSCLLRMTPWHKAGGVLLSLVFWTCYSRKVSTEKTSLEEERSKYTFGRPITTRVINWSTNGHYIYTMGVSTLNSCREVTRYLSLYSALHI